jgi:hypothetical protein
MNSYSFLPLRDFRVLRGEITFHLVFSKTLPVNFFSAPAASDNLELPATLASPPRLKDAVQCGLARVMRSERPKRFRSRARSSFRKILFHLVFSKTLPVNFFLRARSLR